MTSNQEVQDQLVDALKAAKSIVLVTGAGVSLASGIPTFRGTDKNAVWETSIMEMGTFRFFRRNPAESWRWYLSRFGVLEGKVPNAAHHAIVDLERWCERRKTAFLLITQNIDGLHEAAGSKALVEVHGTAHRVRCARVGCDNGSPAGSMARSAVDMTAFLAESTVDNVPTCPLCGDYIRQHVLWFDEMYDGHFDYQVDRAVRASQEARVVVFVGTSFSVGITDMVLQTALVRGARIFSIDPGGLRPSGRMTVLKATAESALPAVISRLNTD